MAIQQNYNRMNGQNNFSCGAQRLSNRISLSVDQQVCIGPLAQAFGAKSVFQAWTFNVRFRTPHGTNANINTFVTSDGRMQWGGYLSGLRYNAVVPVTIGSPSFSKYVISGLVVDETGKGVWGIAIQIGEETVISDSDGGECSDLSAARDIYKDSQLQDAGQAYKQGNGVFSHAACSWLVGVCSRSTRWTVSAEM